MALRTVVPYTDVNVVTLVDPHYGLEPTSRLEVAVKGTLINAIRWASNINCNWILDSRYATVDNFDFNSFKDLKLNEQRITKFSVRRAGWQNQPYSDGELCPINDACMPDASHGGLYYIGDWLRQQFVAGALGHIPHLDSSKINKLFDYSNLELVERRFPYPIRIVVFDEPRQLAERLKDQVTRELKHAPDIAIHHTTKGIFKTHKTVVQATAGSKTPVLFLDADFEPNAGFLAHIKPGIGQEEFTHVWSVTNSMNSNVYGHGGPKLIHPSAFDDQETSKLIPEDMTLSSGKGLVVHDTVVGSHSFSWSAFSTWRTAFREAVKLAKVMQKLDAPNGLLYKEAEERLAIWRGPDLPRFSPIEAGHKNYLKYLSAQGARQGEQMASDPNFDSSIINNYATLLDLFNKHRIHHV